MRACMIRVETSCPTAAPPAPTPAPTSPTTAQPTTCTTRTIPLGCFGQGAPRYEGTHTQASTASGYSMIDIDGAAQMPIGTITYVEYQVFKLAPLTFQVWRPQGFWTSGQFELLYSLTLNPTVTNQAIQVSGLNFNVEAKDRWGFSYAGSDSVPVMYNITRNIPNNGLYYALESTGSAVGASVRNVYSFPTTQIQKQFRMRACMIRVVTECPAPQPTPPPTSPTTSTTLRATSPTTTPASTVCSTRTQPLGCFGQGAPRYDGTHTQASTATGYSMIDIDGAAQMPSGTITYMEYRVTKIRQLEFQVWRPETDYTTGRFTLIYRLTLNPTVIGESIQIANLNFAVQPKDRWGFSYAGSDDVPVRYNVTLNVPNNQPYQAMESAGTAVNAQVGATIQFQTTTVQKQFRMRACMIRFITDCPAPQPTPPPTSPTTSTTRRPTSPTSTPMAPATTSPTTAATTSSTTPPPTSPTSASPTACTTRTLPLGCFGQGAPRYDGTHSQSTTATGYSMIDIDGAAQMPQGTITYVEYRVSFNAPVTFQVWRPIGFWTTGNFRLLYSLELNPSKINEGIQVTGLNFIVQAKDRWGFSYAGTSGNVPVRYNVTLNVPNNQAYRALESAGLAVGASVNTIVKFDANNLVQKQFRMRACMIRILTTCAPQPSPPAVSPTTSVTSPAPTTCGTVLRDIGCFGQGNPSHDGTNLQQGGPYSMIDIDGAAQLPKGVIRAVEYRVWKLAPVTFQVYRQVDILQGLFELLYSLPLNPDRTNVALTITGLQWQVSEKDRWGFSYKGSNDVPIRYNVTRNSPNNEQYMALECNGCAVDLPIGQQMRFSTNRVQKQFRMRACMLAEYSNCPTAAPPTVPTTSSTTPSTSTTTGFCPPTCPAGPPGPPGPPGVAGRKKRETATTTAAPSWALSVGHEVVERVGVEADSQPGQGVRCFIDATPQHSLPLGKIMQISLYATAAGSSVRVQVWRPAEAGSFVLIHEQSVTMTAVGVLNIPLPEWPVEFGDRLGVSSDTNGRLPVAFDEESARRAISRHETNDVHVPGETVQFYSAPLRRYSLSALVKTYENDKKDREIYNTLMLVWVAVLTLVVSLLPIPYCFGSRFQIRYKRMEQPRM